MFCQSSHDQLHIYMACMFILFFLEEDWGGKNPSVPAITTTRRAVASMLNPIVDESAGLMLLKNGGLTSGKRPIQTINTCGYDSLYTIFAALYADLEEVKKQVDELIPDVPFCEMVSSMFTDEKKTAKFSSLLRKRSSMLHALYEGTEHVSYFENGLISIDCETNVNYLMQKLLPADLYSYSRHSQCDRCNDTINSNRCFIDINMDLLEQQTIKKLNNCLLDTLCNENKKCNCGGTKIFDMSFGHVIAIDISLKDRIPEMTLDEIPQCLNILGVIFNIFACVQYIGNDEIGTQGHYVSHIYRRNSRWHLYDDLKAHISYSSTNVRMKVQILFYVQASDRAHVA